MYFDFIYGGVSFVSVIRFYLESNPTSKIWDICTYVFMPKDRQIYREIERQRDMIHVIYSMFCINIMYVHTVYLMIQQDKYICFAVDLVCMYV